ncbi:MAG: DUF2283 domain-containing protein [Dehalococcoidia bacterium]
MRISYDSEVDALSIVFRDTTVETRKLAEGIAGEYDAEGQLVGLEILDATARFAVGDQELRRHHQSFAKHQSHNT